MSGNLYKPIMFFLLITKVILPQNFDLKLDSLNASGWFGGDNNPGQHRNVVVAQSVFINQPIKLETFAFYFTVPFDSAINGTGTGHEVILKLNIRDSLGTILQTDQVDVPATFSGGWVTWDSINYNIDQPGEYIFSTYLVGGIDSNKVTSGQGCDFNAGYPGGVRYAKYAVSDSDASVWGDWSESPWDSDFWLTGILLPTKAEEINLFIQSFHLEQNYPNPFNPTTTIKYQIPNVIAGKEKNHLVTLNIYDVLGNKVTTLINEDKPPGIYEVEFDASGFSSGVYFYLLRAGSLVATKKMILMK
jgi:Secretion system C-terminal sorting domain